MNKPVKAIIIAAADPDAVGMEVGLVDFMPEQTWVVPNGISFLDHGWVVDKPIKNSCGEWTNHVPNRFIRRKD